MPSNEMLIKIGNLTAINKDALIHYEHTHPMIFAHSSKTLELASDLCEGAVLQLLNQHSQGHAKLYLYEAVPSRLFSQIKRLYAKTDKRYGEQVFSAKECAKLLADLTDQAHRRYSQLAAADAHEIFAYNRFAPQPEPFIYLIITSLSSISAEPQSIQLLKYLSQHGPAIGIVPVLFRSSEDESSEDYAEHQRKQILSLWKDISQGMFGLDLRNGIAPIMIPSELWRLFVKFQLVIGLDSATRRQWANELIEAVHEQEATSDQRDFLNIPIGYTGPTRAHFCLGDRSDCYHAMIGGANSTGKTTLLNNIILSACEEFSPDELQLWLFDYKGGVSFHIYNGLSHVEFLHVNQTDIQYANDAFARFVDIITERAELFRSCNPPVSNITGYNRLVTTPLPRIIMIIDEVQTPFDTRDTKVAAKRMIREITRKGRAFGMHLILCTQSYQNVNLESDEKAQFRLRVAFQLSSSMECQALMGRQNDAPLTVPRYTAVFNNNFGEQRDNRIIKLDHLDDGELHRRLQELKDKYPEDQTLKRCMATKEPVTPEAAAIKASPGAGIWDWMK